MKRARLIAWSCVASLAAIGITALIVEAQQASFVRQDMPVFRQSAQFFNAQRLDASVTSPATFGGPGECFWDTTDNCLACYHADAGIACVGNSNQNNDGGLWIKVAARPDAGVYLRPGPGASANVVVGTITPDASPKILAKEIRDGGNNDAHQNLPGTIVAHFEAQGSSDASVALTDPTPNGTFETNGEPVTGYTVYSAASWTCDPGTISQNYLVSGLGDKSAYICRQNTDCGDVPHRPNAGHFMRQGWGDGCDSDVWLHSTSINGTSGSISVSADLTGASTLTWYQTFTNATNAVIYTASVVINRGLADEVTVYSTTTTNNGAAVQITATLPAPQVGIKTLTWLLQQTDDPYAAPDADYRKGTLACRGSDDVSYPGCTGLPGGVTFAYYECVAPCTANCSGTTSTNLYCNPQATPDGPDFECTTSTGGGGGSPMCWRAPHWAIDDVVISGSNRRTVLLNNTGAIVGNASIRPPATGKKVDYAGQIRGGYFLSEHAGNGNVVADGGVVGALAEGKMSASSATYSRNVIGSRGRCTVTAGSGAVLNCTGVIGSVNSSPNTDGGATPDGGFKTTTNATSVATEATIGRPTNTYHGVEVRAPELVGATPTTSVGLYLESYTGSGTTVYSIYSEGSANYLGGTLEVVSAFTADSTARVYGDLRIDDDLSLNGDSGSDYSLLSRASGSPAWLATGTANQVLHGTNLWSAIDLTADVTGTLPVNKGGTGATTLTGILLGNGTSAFTAITSSSGIAGAISDETGSGSLVFGTSATLRTTVTIDTSTSTDDRLILQPYSTGAARFDGTITSADLTGSSKTWTFPNATGTVVTTGNLTDITATGTIASGTWNGTAITVPYGGTGATSLTSNGVLYGNGTSAIGATTAGGTGTVLIGTTSSAPSFSASPSVTSLTTSGQAAHVVGPYNTSAGNTGEVRFLELAANGTNFTAFKGADSQAGDTTYTLPSAYPAGSGYVLSSTTAGVLSWTSTATGGTLTVPNGGTGQTTLTNHGVLVGAGTSAITSLSAAAANTVLAGQGTSSDPAFTATPTVTSLYTTSSAGIGVGVPGGQLEVQGGTVTDGSIAYQILATSTEAFNATPTAGIAFVNNRTSGSSYAIMGAVTVSKENTTSGNSASYLSLHSRVSGGANREGLRLDSTGIVSLKLAQLRLFSSGSDPTGSNGDMYYSTGTNKFRCYQNGAWTDCITTSGGGTVTGTGTSTRVAFWSSSSALSSNANFYWDDSGSQLGIGTTAPGGRLEVQGGTVTDGSIPYQIIATSTEAYNATPTAGILFVNKRNAGGTFVGMGGITVSKENTTSDNNAGFLALHTRPAGAGGNTERLRIDSTGKVGINTTGPTSTLHVNGGVQVGSPTGGDKGSGNVNIAGDIYKNNTAYTNPDYAVEYWVTGGTIERFADRPGAAGYARLSIDDAEEYARRNMHLFRVPREPAGMFERSDIALEKIEEAHTYIFELNRRVKKLERIVESYEMRMSQCQ